MPFLKVRHATTYRYRNPVRFGPHRMMFRPRDSHDLRLIATHLAIDPPPADIRWIYDVFGNSIAVATFDPDLRSDRLAFLSELELVHYVSSLPEFPIEDYARLYPFSYGLDEGPDLARSIERHYPDPEREVDHWARSFARTDGPTATADLLTAMTRAIRDRFRYEAREQSGTQMPVETLRRGAGTCRDFALLMMEAVRALGLAARFATGYIYSPDGRGEGRIGGGATHAWMLAFLPGAGWVSFDPTNGIVGNRDLIRVATVRDPRQAMPLTGTWTGMPGDHLGIEVDVQVTAIPDSGA